MNLKIEEIEKGIIVNGVEDFSPKHIFECGQAFRWNREDNDKESYIGVAKGKVIRVWMKDYNTIVIENTNKEDFYNIWFDYFDLGTDYGDIKRKISKDSIMKEAVKFGHGIRILRQDFFETLISFIISANNRIPRIMKSVELLAEKYGESIYFEGKEYFTFPSKDVLSKVSCEELSFCKAGFRCKYIANTSKMVDDINIPPTKEELMKLSGVGPKVADCVLLFSGIRYDVFPTDVWVKRVMEELYFKKETKFKEIEDFSKEYFGELAGFAQQYLFYYARENRIGVSKA